MCSGAMLLVFPLQLTAHEFSIKSPDASLARIRRSWVRKHFLHPVESKSLSAKTPNATTSCKRSSKRTQKNGMKI
jgi:hypothetical protein